ncbi:MAG TPA: molecular chaperone DnaJ, partial [Cyanobium sp.]|nr:molecular chaperone DnaJ [Cyanobium sp.]
MDLPIDHFRLLGVSPASDAQHVLRTLQQRLDRLPHQGFTPETLQARAELLRASADLLSDSERRTVYEAALTSLARAEEPVVPALDVATPLEMGGLLLLLEADQPLECFEMACRCLQPPQAPALSSGREADLTLLAGLSCLEAAGELRE